MQAGTRCVMCTVLHMHPILLCQAACLRAVTGASGRGTNPRGWMAGTASVCHEAVGRCPAKHDALHRLGDSQPGGSPVLPTLGLGHEGVSL